MGEWWGTDRNIDHRRVPNLMTWFSRGLPGRLAATLPPTGPET
ncbi:DUF1287 domain-containing protein [Pseudomonas aeruginosa]